MKILINLMMFEFTQSATHLQNEPTQEKVMKFGIDIPVYTWGNLFSHLDG